MYSRINGKVRWCRWVVLLWWCICGGGAYGEDEVDEVDEVDGTMKEWWIG